MWWHWQELVYLACSMKITRIVHISLIVLVVSLVFPPSQTHAKTKLDPIESLAGTWDIHCMQKGCLMFTDVLIGDPDHPADLKHPQYITIAVALNRSDRKVAYIDFDLPPYADRAQGFFIAFAKTTMDGNEYKTSLDKNATVHLDFFTCNKDSCIGRAPDGMVESQGNQKVDLLREFLRDDQILFLYTKNGVPYRTIKALFPFQRAYKQLMKTHPWPTGK